MNPFDFNWTRRIKELLRNLDVFGGGSERGQDQAPGAPETAYDRIRRMAEKDPRFDAKGKDELARRVVSQLPTIVERKMGVGDLIADEAEKLLRETGQDRKK